MTWGALIQFHDEYVLSDVCRQSFLELRPAIDIFKAAPFVEVENSYIRQALREQDPMLSNSMRMAFGLRQLRISTHPDIVDAFDCSLTMTWFNYFPYSNDFGYQGTVPSQSVDSTDCPAFQQYIDTWKTMNLDSTTDSSFEVPIADWKNLTPGTVKLRWREYRTLKYNQAVVTDAVPAATAALANVTPATISNGSPSDMARLRVLADVAPYSRLDKTRCLPAAAKHNPSRAEPAAGTPPGNRVSARPASRCRAARTPPSPRK